MGYFCIFARKANDEEDNIFSYGITLTGCAPAEEREKEHLSRIIIVDGEIVGNERKASEEQTEEAISRFLIRHRNV